MAGDDASIEAPAANARWLNSADEKTTAAKIAAVGESAGL
jgi:hypothetical protein